MKKQHHKSLFLLLLLFGITLSNTNPTNAQVTSVKVGLLSPQTGGLSAYSLGFEQGAQLAIDHLNNDPSLNAFYTFSLTTYDTRTDPTASATAMTAAITAGMHYVVGAAGSSNTLAAAAVAVANEIPLISYASTSPALTLYDDHKIVGDNGYLWRIPPSDANQGEVIANLAYDGGYRNMVIVVIDNSYGSGVSVSINDTFITQGGNVNAVVTYPGTTTDFSAIVTQIKSANPDIVVAISFFSDGAKLFVEMTNQNLGVPVIGSDGVAGDGIFAEHVDAQTAMQGFLTVKPISADTPEAQAFTNAYINAFTNTVGHIYTAETYDAVWAGALAIAAQGSVVGQDIINGLGSINWAGASGPISFDKNGDSSAGLYQVSEVRLDQMAQVATWDKINGTIYLDTTFYNRWIRTPTTVNIGFLSPMTGALSAYSLGFGQAAQLAISHLNSDPNFGNFNFELSIYDTQTDPTASATAMTAAVTAGMHYVVGAAGSSNTLSAAAIAKSYEIPLINYASTSPALSYYDDHAIMGDNGYLWRTASSDAFQGRTIATLAQAGNYSKMTIVAIDTPYGIEMANITKSEFEAIGGTVVSTLIYHQSNLDFYDLVSQIATDNPEVVVAITYRNDGANLFVEMSNQNLNLPVIGNDGLADISIFSERVGTQDAMQGFVVLSRQYPSTPEASDFLTDYLAAYENSNSDIFIREVYDAIFAGALAVKLSNSTTGSDIIDGLSFVSFDGASGYISFDENGDTKFAKYGILEVQGSNMIEVGTWDSMDSLSFQDNLFIDRWRFTGSSNPTTTSITSSVTSSIVTVTETQSATSSDENNNTPDVAIPFSIFGLFTALIIVNLITRVVRRK